jgi:uncharacterized protein YdhG (YjbR/CyaY superfamily)
MTAPASVDDYLATLPASSRAALQRLRETVKALAPEATETISYQMPTFKLNGRSLLAYAAFKNHCSLFPMSTGVIDAHREELQPYFAGRGTLRFHPDRPLPDALLQTLVKERIMEIAAPARYG